MTTENLQREPEQGSTSEPDNWLLGLVRRESVPSKAELTRILRDYCRTGSRAETRWLDFKAIFDCTKRAWAELLKDIVAMANSGGGIIIFGVDDQGKRVGCNSDLEKELDPARISDKLSAYSTAARIDTACHLLRYYRKTFLFLIVKPSHRILVFDKPFSFPDGKRHRRVFSQGVVYVRRPGGNIEATQSDLDQLIDRAWQHHVRQFLARIQDAALLPPGTQLIARNPTEPTRGYVLEGNGTGRLVSIQDHPDAIPVSVVEMISPQRPFSSLDAEVAGQVRQWKHADSSHRVPRKTLNRWYLRRDEMNIDDDVAEFCFLSAGYGRGFVMFWAAKMSRSRLADVIRRELEIAAFPTVGILPYVVAGFFWDDREALLDPLLTGRRGTKTPQQLAERVASEPDRETFLRSARFSGKSFTLNGERKTFQPLTEDLTAAQEVFGAILELDAAGGSDSTIRSVAHQLDILLHVPPESAQ